MNSVTAKGNGTQPQGGSEGPAAHTLDIGNVRVDLAAFKASVAGRPVRLTYQEFELLRHLADSRDRIVSFDTLSGLLWGAAGIRQTRRLNVLVCRLRGKLRDSAPYRLETVRGRGYGLLSDGAGRPAAANEGGDVNET